jgi:hypothetical protein
MGATIELLNIRADPYIKVMCHPTSNTNRWSINEFIDPTDEEVWDENDLDSIERGHVYMWKEDADAWIHIFMPYRVMDEETGNLIKGIKTYRSTAPFVTGKQYALDKFAKSPKSCLQTFRFTREFFSLFSKRVEELGGILEKDEIDVPSLISHIQSTRDTVKSVGEEVSNLRDLYCSATGVDMSKKEKLSETLEEFSFVRSQISSVKKERTLIIVTLDRLKQEIRRKTAYTEAKEWFDTFSTELSNLERTDFERLEREAIHKHRRDAGEVSLTARPPTLMALVTEISNLKQYYPSLQKLTVSGEDISLKLPGLEITLLSDGSVKVTGDPAVLKPYIEGSSAIQAQGRRRRAIYTKEEN